MIAITHFKKLKYNQTFLEAYRTRLWFCSPKILCTRLFCFFIYHTLLHSGLLVLLYRLANDLLHLVVSLGIALKIVSIFSWSHQTHHVFRQHYDSYYTLSLVHGGAYSYVMKGRVQKSRSPFPGSQTVIDKQPLNHLFSCFTPEFSLTSLIFPLAMTKSLALSGKD
jgi:hypothetical protein